MEFSAEDQMRYKALLLQTYKVFANFCKDAGIQFFAAGGTMIGAVRHQGFIPWDDDIDVYMKRPDYDKFISLRDQLEGTDYEVIDSDTDGYYCAMAKFSHRNSTIWEYQGIPFILGAYVDVFVLDYEEGAYNEVANKRMNFAKKVDHFFISSNDHAYKEIKYLFVHGDLKKTILYLFQKLFFKAYHSLLKKQLKNFSTNNQGDWLVAYTGTSGLKDLFRSEWFADSIRYPFEDTFINVPSGYDQFLTAMFGDYMTLPPIENQCSHHPLFYYYLDRRITKPEIQQIQMGAI